jgi:hypothetical protein
MRNSIDFGGVFERLICPCAMGTVIKQVKEVMVRGYVHYA